jgi:NAD(P)-dependent dehydrogenase (short-subunit alcohol dehydrogenase family)
MGRLDFVVHAIAFSDKNELKGRYADTTRENFTRTMVISCFSFTEIAKRAAALMPNGGSMLTLTYGGSTRVMPNYNVMGVAKAALESSVRYLAADFGPQASASTPSRPGRCARWPAPASPTRADVQFPEAPFAAAPGVTLDEIGGAALYLLSTCRPASPARSISSIPATTSSPCRAHSRRTLAQSRAAAVARATRVRWDCQLGPADRTAPALHQYCRLCLRGECRVASCHQFLL